MTDSKIVLCPWCEEKFHRGWPDKELVLDEQAMKNMKKGTKCGLCSHRAVRAYKIVDRRACDD